jgi:FHA domain
MDWTDLGIDEEGFVQASALRSLDPVSLAHLLRSTPALVVGDPGLGASQQREPAANAQAAVSGPRVDLVTLTSQEPSATAAYQGRVALLRKRPGHPFPDMIFLGRTRACDLTVDLPTLSKMHAYFTRSGAWAITDQRSTNGTFLNDQRLAGGQSTPLVDGDRLAFGSDLVLLYRGPGLVMTPLQESPVRVP